MGMVLERPLAPELAEHICAMPLGRRMVAIALVGGWKARTYAEVAEGTPLG